MPIRRVVRGLLSGPLASLFEAALRDLVEEVLDAQHLAKRAELQQLLERTEAFRRELSERTSELYALRQAVEAANHDDDDLDALLSGDLAESIAQLDASRAEIAGRLDRGTNALDVARSQLDTLSDRLDSLAARAEQAWTVAHAARTTAEAAADGVSGLESTTSA